MDTVGIRELKQNASAVVAEAVGGATITITDRGRPVARLTAIAKTPLQRLLDNGRARPPLRDLLRLPVPAKGPALSEELARMRGAERY